MIVVFPFLVYEEAYTCLSTVGLRVVQQVATLESCETFLFSSDFSEPYHVPFHGFFSSSSSSCTCSSFSNVLTLYVAIFSRSPLVRWFFLTQRFLAPPVSYVVSADPNHLLGHIHPCCWGLEALAYLYIACWFSWPTLPRCTVLIISMICHVAKKKPVFFRVASFQFV